MNQGVDSTDKYVIKVRFPKENDTNAEYSDLIEYIKLDLSAKQIIDQKHAPKKKRDNPCKLHRKKAISNVQGGKNEQLNGYISEI